MVACLALDDLPAALELARQGLGAAPQDVELTKRAALAAVEGNDDELACGTPLKRLPVRPTRPFSVFATTPHAATNEVARIGREQNDTIPDVERALVVTTCRLAELKLQQPNDLDVKIKAITDEVTDDARASIIITELGAGWRVWSPSPRLRFALL